MHHQASLLVLIGEWFCDGMICLGVALLSREDDFYSIVSQHCHILFFDAVRW